MIGTPAYGGTFMGNYEMAMSETRRWAQKIGLQIIPQFLFGATYIDLARNYISNAFLKSDCTHLFMIDADVGWIPNNFFELILCDTSIISGLYPKRAINWTAVANAVRAGVPDHLLSHCAGDFPITPMPGKDITLGHEPQEVFSVPTGFTCFSREVFESYAKHLDAIPSRKCTQGSKGDFGYQFFYTGMIEQEGKWGWDGEDNHFCRDLRTLGIKSYIAPWVSCTHFGPSMFEACWPCSIGHYVHIPKVANG